MQKHAASGGFLATARGSCLIKCYVTIINIVVRQRRVYL